MKTIEDEICSKCGGQEIYLQEDGKTLRCWKCKHEWLAYWIKEIEQ